MITIQEKWPSKGLGRFEVTSELGTSIYEFEDGSEQLDQLKNARKEAKRIQQRLPFHVPVLDLLNILKPL
jgi:hypothetical protein